MKKILLLVLTCLSLSLVAEENLNNDKQWGIGWQFGSTSTQANSGSEEYNLNINDFFFNAGLQLEYRKNHYLSYKLGNFGGEESLFNIFSGLFGDSTEYSFQTTYITASARTSSPLYVFGGLGVGYSKEKIKNEDVVISSEDSLNLVLEAGAGWDISEHFSTNFAYVFTNAEYADITSLQLTVQYRF
jgi:hypothetical protein